VIMADLRMIVSLVFTLHFVYGAAKCSNLTINTISGRGARYPPFRTCPDGIKRQICTTSFALVAGSGAAEKYLSMQR
jgi:hypothetical protein